MRLAKLLGIGGIIIVALCGWPQSVHAQSGQKAEAAAAQSGQPAKETKDGYQQAGDKMDGDKNAPKTTPTPTWLEATKAILDKLMNWVLVALVFLVVFRAKLAALLDSVTQAMGERGVTLEVAKVKIQVSERTEDLDDDRSKRFSVSPFDLERDPFEGLVDHREVAPQLTFPVSDDRALFWTTDHPDDATSAEEKFKALKEKIGEVVDLKDVMKELVAFARALEKARFLDAERLKNLLESHRGVRDELVLLARRSRADRPDQQIVVHATGVAYAQSGAWSTARALLEPIAWATDHSVYLPAADAWLASMYHDGIEKALSPGSAAARDTFLEKVVHTAKEVVSKAEEVRDAMNRDSDWSPNQVNVAYYRRAVFTVLGTVLAIRAEYDPGVRRSVLDRAEEAFRLCLDNINGEGPTPFDHNNLADTYRQLGCFGKAHNEVDEALAKSGQDPAFLNTKALIFIDEKKLVEALRVLTAVPQEKMADARPQDVVQYLDNQMLAAKVVSSTDRPPVVRLYQAAEILETAGRFLHAQATRPNERKREVARLGAELNELLGFTYLGLPGYERRSVEHFEYVASLWDEVPVTAEFRWRRRLGGVRAYTRLARVSRRNFDYGTAHDQRTLGRKVINDNLAELPILSVEADQPVALRLRHARVQLDTATALQHLAEEFFQAVEHSDAKKLLDEKSVILARLNDFREDEAIGANIRLADAETGLLRGLLAFHGDPGTYEPAVLNDIEKNLLPARGHGPLLDCQIDLALGEAFLAAALAGKEGDATANYRKAIGALEFAVGRNAPALRADATRALVDAYARRPAVQRRAKAKESKRA